ncbi:TPA: hypothetical protein DCW38_04725 [candidate division WOR-3 bacterium]|jgi:DNA polymerase III delta subunit|uniref:DNA polymerase III delta N-terminal domain-containing protein n=1 Tax=candidate division WOR-3 bacterium TaxID=2052148 RepID=A0A350HAA1_UNCW3|nr:hypothetical protein [candidate division WOR-3 bacterium]
MSDAFIKLAQKSNYIAVAGTHNDGIHSLIEILKKEFISEGFEDFDFIDIYADTVDIEDAVNRVLAPPFISKRKVIILRNPDSLSKNNAEELNKAFLSLDERSLAVILYIDEFAGSTKNIMKSIEERFKGADIYQHVVVRAGAKDEIDLFLKERNLKLSDKKIAELLEKTNSSLNNALNILNMWYISNDDSIINEILENAFDLDFSQTLQYKISDAFFRRDKRLAIEIADKVVKWNIMNIDGIVLMLMWEIEKARNPFNNKSGFSNNEAKKWRIDELDSAFEKLYMLLRDLRSHSNSFSELLIQQNIINILERG